MAGSYDEQEYTGPHRATAPQSDTMNMGAGPHRVAQLDTMAAGPHRVAQLDTMNLEAPVRVQQDSPLNSKETAGEAWDAGYCTEAAPPLGGYTGVSGQTPRNQALEVQSAAGVGRMHIGLVIASLCLRAAAVVSLIIGLTVLASDSQTIDGFTVSFSTFSSTKYVLAAAIIGTVYSIYETVSAAVRLGTGHLLFPGDFSLFISYIGDQVVIVLLLTSGSAAAATLKNLQDVQNIYGTSYCDILSDWCKQGASAIAMIFLGFGFLAASLVISSFCFYKRKT